MVSGAQITTASTQPKPIPRSNGPISAGAISAGVGVDGPYITISGDGLRKVPPAGPGILDPAAAPGRAAGTGDGIADGPQAQRNTSLRESPAGPVTQRLGD